MPPATHPIRRCLTGASPARARPRTTHRKRMPHACHHTPAAGAAGASHARCQALFASALQPSDPPDAGMIAAAISSAVQRLGPRGCTELMAQAIGDHPDAAARRSAGPAGSQPRGRRRVHPRTPQPGAVAAS
jgi:hypothetical protein